jgi:UPF0755 protein
VTQRDHESLTDHDPHALLFGPDDGDEHGYDDAPRARTRSEERHARHAHAAQGRRRSSRRLLLVLSLVAVLVVGVSAWLIVPKVLDMIHTPDYSGTGSGSVAITVGQGDTATDIGSTLQKAGVVKSEQAFVDAANANSDSQGIQPGTYTLRRHMSAKSALALLLDPKSRSAAGDLVVPEGATTFDIEQRLVKVLGAGKQGAIEKALADPAGLGIPLGYKPESGPFTTVEGFLYPATYTLDPKMSASAALQRMTSSFAEHDRSSDFAADAQKLGITPYQALIIASIAQSEAKYPDDMAKVARVILNRIAAHRPLQIDATTRYGALVNGVPKDKLGTISYHTYDSPYNSYTHDGLPPSPISNPGADAMAAAVHPPAGDWLYYVNADAQGHLFFTSSEAKFEQARQKCADNNWGCAD